MRSNQSKRIQQAELDTELQDLTVGVSEAGVVVSRFGQHAIILDDKGEQQRCHIRRAVESLVCGDEVIWQRLEQQSDGVSGVIEAVQPRRSLLSRPDYYDGVKPVAANIDRILVVSSVLPAFTTQIIDRYLVACEDIEITPIIILNKADLLVTISAEERLEIEQALRRYKTIGYQVIQVSAKQEQGLDQLQQVLQDHVSIVVGQSGVGKSSLVNALLPAVDAQVKSVSENSGLGQHTTTVATRYELPDGGILIDSPGIRDFALWHLEPERVAWCFIDFRPYLGGCKFRDCKHQTDPGCALIAAAEAGDLFSERLDNFYRIIESMAQQKPSRAKSRGEK